MEGVKKQKTLVGKSSRLHSQTLVGSLKEVHAYSSPPLLKVRAYKSGMAWVSMSMEPPWRKEQSGDRETPSLW